MTQFNDILVGYVTITPRVCGRVKGLVLSICLSVVCLSSLKIGLSHDLQGYAIARPDSNIKKWTVFT